MKNISILLTIILSSLLISCGEMEETPEDEYNNSFGYHSKYSGKTNHAYFNGYDNAEIMAKKLVEGINQANKIYRNATTALIPELFLEDNIKRKYDYDNGTCPINSGKRKYKTMYISDIPNPDNYTHISNINYLEYCLYNELDPLKKQVIVNKDNIRLEENYKFDGNNNKILDYKLNVENIELKIQENTINWDNMTINGLILRHTIYPIHTEKVLKDNFTISLDMPRQETQYRFDFYTNIESNSNTTNNHENLTIKFYHYDYGYITADVSFLKNNQTVSNGDQITMLFRDNRACTFSPNEFNTDDFNCM